MILHIVLVLLVTLTQVFSLQLPSKLISRPQVSENQTDLIIKNNIYKDKGIFETFPELKVILDLLCNKTEAYRKSLNNSNLVNSTTTSLAPSATASANVTTTVSLSTTTTSPTATTTATPKATTTVASKRTTRYLTAPTAKPSPQTNSGGDASGCLQAHNSYRALGGAAPLVWDNNLANAATNWARSLASSRRFEHGSGGENLYSGFIWDSCQRAVKSWYDEKDDYNGEPIGQGDFGEYGHFTQLMWKSAKAVGCGYADNFGKRIWVCRYNIGNVAGVPLSRS